MKLPILLLSQLLILALGTVNANAQQLDLSFKPDPKIHEVCNAKFLKESAVIILEQEQLVYSFKEPTKLGQTKTIHKIVRINDEKGVEMYNKMRIGYNPSTQIYNIKGRTILPNNKVIEIAPSDVKEVKEDDGTMYKVFALPAVEIGAEVEYCYTVEPSLQLYGATYMQDAMPTCLNQFEIVAPKNLVFEMKGYNNVIVDDGILKDTKRSILAHIENAPGLEEEKYASYMPHFGRVQYTFVYNSSYPTTEPAFSWDDIAKNIYKTYNNFTKKQLKLVEGILDNNKDFNACKTNLAKIEFIENYVKTNYQQQEYIEDKDASEIEYTVKNKLTDETGIRNLFCAFFTVYEIPFEIGYTTNRMQNPFDYDFVNPSNLKECVLYFPETNQYLSPNTPYYRTPFMPGVYYQNSILFTNSQGVTPDKVTAQKKLIAPHTPAASYHNHVVDVKFSEDMDTAIIQYDNYFLGHNAIDVLPAIVYLEGDKQKEFLKQILSINGKEDRMENFQFNNNNFKSITDGKPLKVGATIHSTSSLEKAGPKYLFKIGELIGPQSEMYQEKERQFDLEIPNPHQYTRTITTHVPDGYKLTNLDKLNMFVEAKENGKVNCSFKSDYTLKDNLLTVNVFEIYHQVLTPKSIYEPYRKVINAAADFNKIVIILEKK